MTRNPEGRIDLRRFPTRRQMGRAAAADLAAEMRHRFDRQVEIRMIFAAAPSQQEMLEALVEEPGLDWERVTAFHMDEYHTLPPGAPQRFDGWLKRTLFDRIPIGVVHSMTPEPDVETCIRTYADLLAETPIDIVCLGIGAGGELAFNDPSAADLADPQAVKVVALDPGRRLRQAGDGAFARVEDVPARALTLTIPRLLDADRLFCVVPGAAKRDALRRTLRDPIGTACPATALCTHPHCTIYCDAAAMPEAA